jgi:hypothetical protein
MGSVLCKSYGEAAKNKQQQKQMLGFFAALRMTGQTGLGEDEVEND